MQEKNAAASYDKWLLVNMQSTNEFTSHMVVSKFLVCLFIIIVFSCWHILTWNHYISLWSLIGIHGQMKLFLKLLCPIFSSGRSVISW